MWYDESHEADHPGTGNGCRCGERGINDEPDADFIDRNSQLDRLIVTELQDVQRVGIAELAGNSDEDQRSGEKDAVPSRDPSAAKHPGKGAFDFQSADEDPDRAQSRSESVDRGAREEKARYIQISAHPSQVENQKYRDYGKNKGKQWYHKSGKFAVLPGNGHGDDRSEARAGGDPDEVRIRKRIAEKPLITGPAARQSRSGETHHQHAGDPQHK